MVMDLENSSVNEPRPVRRLWMMPWGTKPGLRNSSINSEVLERHPLRPRILLNNTLSVWRTTGQELLPRRVILVPQLKRRHLEGSMKLKKLAFGKHETENWLMQLLGRITREQTQSRRLPGRSWKQSCREHDA